jgi:aryl-phospho-beta-D-glucosidase BglC (GH1 family)/PKD repeat protein
MRTSLQLTTKTSYSFIRLVPLIFLLLTTLSSSGQTPVGANGQLSISGTFLTNKNGTPIQLRGLSTHGPQWYSSCLNFNSINAMVNDWGIDVLRLAMYVEEEGYIVNPAYWKSWIDDMVDICGQYGIYCIIDWHVHNPGDPWSNIDDARDFWEYMSSQHAGKKHVLYEICNEPNGVDWSRVKSYAEEIIPIIRSNDPNSVIIVGTPNWSQDVDIAANDPLNYDNIMYSLHFYAGSHGSNLRQKAKTALSSGIAIMVTEWGTSTANGDGGPYLNESDTWIEWMQENAISWCNWSYSDKDEVSAALEPGSCLSYQWNNATASGTYVKEALLTPEDSWSSTGGNIPPVVNITKPTDGIIIEKSDSLSIESIAIDADGNITLVEFFANGTKIGESSSEPYTITWKPGVSGEYSITAMATDNSNETGTSSAIDISVVEKINQYAYPDSIPHSIPGSIEGVYFDTGGEGIAYHDADEVHKGDGIRQDEGVDTEPSVGAGNVGYVVNDEWLEYTIKVKSSGTYDIQLKVASEPGGGKFHLEFNKVNLTGTVDVASTGSWSSYQALTISDVSLTQGEQVMRIVVETGDFNFALFTFTKTGDSPTPAAPEASISANPLSGDAELEVTFDGSASSDTDGELTSYFWDFGDGQTDSGSIVTHTFTSPGVYNAYLIVTDSDELTDTASVTIIVTDPSGEENIAPVALFSATPEFGDYPLTVNFDATPSFDADGNITKYSWEFGDLNTAEGSIVSNTYLDPGSYNATLTVTDNDNAIGQSTLTILVTDPSDGEYCDSPETITLPFSFDGAGEFCWVSAEKPDFVNSWNCDKIQVNGTDYTNDWSDSFTAADDGLYYIYYKASFGWSHFEAALTKSAHKAMPRLQETKTPGINNVIIYPNPFVNSFTIKIPEQEKIISAKIYDQTGRFVMSIPRNKLIEELKIGGSLPVGFYFIRIETEAGKSVLKVRKK